MLILKSCFRCRYGDVEERSDMFGRFNQCLQCGDVTYPPEESSFNIQQAVADLSRNPKAKWE